MDAERLAARIAALGLEGSPHLDDAALAFACAEQSPRALAEFERRFGREFAGALSRLSLDRAAIDEVAQTVRERLFVRRRILDYAGRGTLAGWLRAVVVRAGIDLRRARAQDPARAGAAEEPLLEVTASTDDPELEDLRRRFREPFRDAFRDALAALGVDERNVLRLNVVEGLNIEQIGVVYGVHRATIARWIASARETVGATTRRLLAERLGLAPRDVESLVRLCQSRLEIGLSVLTAPSPSTPVPRH